MEFDSYIDWLNEVKKLPFNDIIFGVKDTIQADTLYISVESSKNIKMDNSIWTIGYTYSLVLSVPNVDSPLVASMAALTQDGWTMQSWSNESHLYNYTGTVYLPVGGGGQPFQ